MITQVVLNNNLNKMRTLSRIFLSLLILSGTGLVNAQKFSFGVAAGSNFAVQSPIADYYYNENIRTGVHGGIFSRYLVNERISFLAELNYDQLGAKNQEIKNNFDYLNAPVLFNYSLGKSDLTPLTFDIYLGPYVGYLLKAESKTETPETSQTADLKESTNKITGGSLLGFGLRYPFGNQKLMFDIRLGLGLAPYEKTDYRPKNKYVRISLGYEF